ncbi:MAG TPA: malto-oligosyltrehalose trehalohydrolase [Steroidobacteraceae bacterium]|nr:malto-oligosyltrehalose trehalohydrolase [Steroidobacteraceae bacterium]
MKFSVWAPLAKTSVELVCADERFAMRADEAGNWSIECTPGAIADGYRYSLDGGPPLPDPRSAWQPLGVHAASFIVDESELKAITRSEFRQQPLGNAVIYELHIGTFTPEGTYAAAAVKLPYLASLGITHLELMPLASFPGEHGWGYDGVYLYAPQSSYGTPADLARFIAACHAHNLAVLLDVVYNHLGPDGNYLSQFAPYFTDRVRTTWGDAVNYDGADSDGVRQFVIDNARRWLDVYGFDGLRLDAVHAIYGFEAVHVLEELASSLHAWASAAGRSIVLIAESDLNDPRLVHSPARGGYGLDAHWSDDFHHALHRVVTGESSGYYADFDGIKDLAGALRDGYVYQGQRSIHRRRRHGRTPLDVRPDQLVVSSQNHDQIGNRAQGERLSMMLKPLQLKAVAALTILSPFVPLLFQGEEWGAGTPFLYFTDHQNQELGQLVAAGRRKEFASFSWQAEVPDPQSAATFLASRLNWEELSQPVHQDLLSWYRRLIALKTSRTRASAHTVDVACEAVGSWLSFSNGDVCVAANFAELATNFALPEGNWQQELSSVSDAPGAAQLAAHETRIYRRSR